MRQIRKLLQNPGCYYWRSSHQASILGQRSAQPWARTELHPRGAADSMDSISQNSKAVDECGGSTRNAESLAYRFRRSEMFELIMADEA